MNLILKLEKALLPLKNINHWEDRFAIESASETKKILEKIIFELKKEQN